ncbi:MAG: TerB N-terminal domain-containing protein [Defluviitaleaceae bacterium]|nr:TerB N-terminal domain-containing protein [Defluviitaleaceae bacterium]
MMKDVFVEIEYDTAPNMPVSTDSQHIGDIATDPVRRMFYDMRGLASDNPNTWNEASLFYKQAKFMENFVDDYEGYAEFSMYSPNYQRMSFDKLRTYFTWRTKVRAGELDKPICLSYRFLYIYELLACIGASDVSNALSKLLTVWKAWHEDVPELDKYFPRWLKDFHIYYELPHTFDEFIEKNQLRHFYSEIFMFDYESENCLELWNYIANYDITESKFYNDNPENAALIKKAFRAVLYKLDAHFSRNNDGKSFKDLFFYCSVYTILWAPFKRAQFFPWLRQNDRTVAFANGEKYICRDNKWECAHLIPRNFNSLLAGFIIKKTESRIRRIKHYKPALPLPYNRTSKARQLFKEFETDDYAFNATIISAVRDFYENYQAEVNRVIVNVDIENLARIREESDDTAEKLIVDEIPMPIEAVPTETIIPPPKPILLSEPTSIWISLKEALTEIEKMTLTLALEGSDIKSFAASQGILLEVLADGINEKAMDIIGDNILDCIDTIEIYDDYKDNLKEVYEK